jgi:hypothetical protein
MSRGVPTSRVRDGRTEDTDPVLDEPFVTKPMRVKYVERQVGAASDGFLKSKGGIAVPGGIVTIEPHLSRDGQVPRAKVLLQATTAMGAANVKRDIVVWDEAHDQQLYRDGPYDSITVNRPLERIVAELKRDGVDAFVRSRGGGDSRTISVTRETPGQVYEPPVRASSTTGRKSVDSSSAANSYRRRGSGSWLLRKRWVADEHSGAGIGDPPCPLWVRRGPGSTLVAPRRGGRSAVQGERHGWLRQSALG